MSGTKLVPRDPIQEALVAKRNEKIREKEDRDRDERREANEAINDRLQAILDRPSPDNTRTLEDIRDKT